MAKNSLFLYGFLFLHPFLHVCVRLNKSFVMEVVGVVAAFDSREIGNKGLSVSHY